MKGGNSPLYDFDIYRRSLGSGAVERWEGLGTSLFDMSFTPGGDLLLVGQEARNAELRNEPAVRDADTGFTRSLLHLIQDPCGAQPTVLTRDLNAVAGATATEELLYPVSSRGFELKVGSQPVAKSEALAQPTGAVAFEAPGGTKAFVAAFASDRIGVIDIDPAVAPASWGRRTIDIDVAAGSDNPMAGPRALALKASADGATGPRLYVLNRLDNSVTVIDPVAETVVETFPLTHDPTPEYIRHGRELLYSADLSGNGFVSCASCHLDGRTDGLGWDLGDAPGTPAKPLDPVLIDDFQLLFDFFPVDKSWLVTQSLQGLLNFEVDQDSQSLFTNAPYHWRGDREDFLTFNVAFEGLLGGQQLADAEMRAFEEMVNSIHYPPNPKQPIDRGFSGELGNVEDLVTGSGALLGMKLFHQVNSDGFAACAHCHTLPSGSNNRITEAPEAKGGHVIDLFEPPQPTETAALRGMLQKEARLAIDDDVNPSHVAISGLEGVTHTGFISPPFLPTFNDFASIDLFLRALFGDPFCGDFFITCPDLQAVLQFTLELDWGLAPTIGYSLTVEPANALSAAVTAQLDLLEQEARRAHTGLVVQAWIAGAQRAFWFDPSTLPTPYREITGGPSLGRAALLGQLLAQGDRAVFQGVPLGDERRIADASGAPAPLAGPAPSQLELLPAAPRQSLAPIPSMVTMWRDPVNPIFVDFGGRLAHTLRVFQSALVQEAPDAFGLAGVQWDVARRFRVAGTDIRHGAELHLYSHDDPVAGTAPNTNLAPEDPGQVELRRTVVPLYATDQQTPSGQTVWQSAVEAEPETLYLLMLGGEHAPGVEAAYQDLDFNISEPPPPGFFDPVGWNWHYLRVVNADGTAGAGGWVRVTLD
jgi:YVTN family beta-propeller protein